MQKLNNVSKMLKKSYNANTAKIQRDGKDTKKKQKCKN